MFRRGEYRSDRTRSTLNMREVCPTAHRATLLNEKVDTPTAPPLNSTADGGSRKERMAEGFKLGQLLATPGVLEAAEGDDLMAYLSRHARGDWGIVGDADKRANDRALVEGTRLLSAYLLRDGTKIWVITECDRSATTILLPDEY